MSLKQEFEFLRRVPAFAEIEPAKLKLVAFMSERVGFDDGKFLCHQGDPADAAYLIIEGEADIILEGPGGPMTVATLGANDIVGDIAGFAPGVGRGKGRPYAHLRSLFPDRAIYVCERGVAPHPDCVPPPEMLILGDMREPLGAGAGRLGGRIAFAHLDVGTGDA